MQKYIAEKILSQIETAQYEQHIKVRGNISEEKLYGLGAKKIGSFVHEDIYYTPKKSSSLDPFELYRIRTDSSENTLFTYKKTLDSHKHKLVFSSIVSKKEISEIKKICEEAARVNKKRTVFILDTIIIAIDQVENLGEFVEFEIHNRDKNPIKNEESLIMGLIKELGLENEKTLNESYYELIIEQQKPLDRMFIKINEKFGKLSFGISSAVMTTLGIIVGVNAATQSRIGVIGAIFAVAIADSLSDAMGMYNQKKSERGVNETSAIKSAINVMFGKIFFTLSFIVPFIFFEVNEAISLSIVWGIILLSLVSTQIAITQKENKIKAITKTIIFAAIMIILSYFIGEFVAFYFK